MAPADEVLVLVEHQADALGVPPVGVLERGGGVELVFGALEEHGAVRERDRHTADLRVLEVLQVVAVAHDGHRLRREGRLGH